jgi:iron uptake system component EfeO
VTHSVARRTLARLTPFAAAVVLTAACTPNSPGASDDSGAIPVSSTATECAVGTTQAPSGTLTFRVTNDGPDVTEFYLLADDGLRIVGEVENIGPGLTRDLVLAVRPGEYFTACKPGMVGDGIRAGFTVTDSGAPVGPAGDTAEQIAAAVATYLDYVEDQTDQLLTGTISFADAVKAGDDNTARSLYAATRMHWERIETVAESFGDLDPAMDAREADLEPGQEWTGWHALEKDLWPPQPTDNGGTDYVPLTSGERTVLADKLVADTQTLYDRVHAPDFAETIDAADIGNGARGLLDEVATGKVTGEEEIWSHTDLWDFQANIDGAKVAYDILRDVVSATDSDLAATLDARFANVQALLDAQRDGDGFVLYTELSDDEVRALAAAVDALSEPLSRLTATVLS